MPRRIFYKNIYIVAMAMTTECYRTEAVCSLSLLVIIILIFDDSSLIAIISVDGLGVSDTINEISMLK